MIKMTKKVENGLLLCLYLARKGRTRLETASGHLGVSLHFLEQIALKLRNENVLTSFRGPGGGYDILPDVTAFDVMKALSQSNKITPTPATFEGATVQALVDNVTKTLNNSLNNTLSSLVESLTPLVEQEKVSSEIQANS